MAMYTVPVQFGSPATKHWSCQVDGIFLSIDITRKQMRFIGYRRLWWKGVVPAHATRIPLKLADVYKECVSLPEQRPPGGSTRLFTRW